MATLRARIQMALIVVVTGTVVAGCWTFGIEDEYEHPVAVNILVPAGTLWSGARITCEMEVLYVRNGRVEPDTVLPGGARVAWWAENPAIAYIERVPADATQVVVHARAPGEASLAVELIIDDIELRDSVVVLVVD